MGLVWQTETLEKSLVVKVGGIMFLHSTVTCGASGPLQKPTGPDSSALNSPFAHKLKYMFPSSVQTEGQEWFLIHVHRVWLKRRAGLRNSGRRNYFLSPSSPTAQQLWGPHPTPLIFPSSPPLFSLPSPPIFVFSLFLIDLLSLHTSVFMKKPWP